MSSRVVIPPAAVFRTLTTCLNSVSSADLENPGFLERVLRTTCDQGLVGPLLRSVAEDERLLAESAARSYRHANGFVKIVLARGTKTDSAPPEWALRLHLHQHAGAPEPKAEGDAEGGGAADHAFPAEHVHDHRWAFASAILKGTLTEDRFATTGYSARSSRANVSPVPHMAYRYEPGEESFVADPVVSARTGRIEVVDLYRTARLRHPEGSSYSVCASELHAIVAGSDAAASAACTTLVLTGRPVSQWCSLFSRPDVAPAAVTSKVPLSEAEVRRILTDEQHASSFTRGG